MPREVVTLNLGQCGVQVANSVWEMLASERGIDRAGTLTQEAEDFETDRIFPLFSRNSNGTHAPRTMFIDSEPGAIEDTILTSKIKPLYIPEFCVSGNSDSVINPKILNIFDFITLIMESLTFHSSYFHTISSF